MVGVSSSKLHPVFPRPPRWEEGSASLAFLRFSMRTRPIPPLSRPLLLRWLYAAVIVASKGRERAVTAAVS